MRSSPVTSCWVGTPGRSWRTARRSRRWGTSSPGSRPTRPSPDVPELPEVQAHAERLTDEFGGAVLERFRPIAFTALKTFSPDPKIGRAHVRTPVTNAQIVSRLLLDK